MFCGFSAMIEIQEMTDKEIDDVLQGVGYDILRVQAMIGRTRGCVATDHKGKSDPDACYQYPMDG